MFAGSLPRPHFAAAFAGHELRRDRSSHGPAARHRKEQIVQSTRNDAGDLRRTRRYRNISETYELQHTKSISDVAADERAKADGNVPAPVTACKPHRSGRGTRRADRYLA